MLAILNLGGFEILLILAVVLLLFGAKKLPELAKGLGQGIREFKQATGGASESMRKIIEEEPPVAARRLPSAPAEKEEAVTQVAAEAKS